MSQVYECNQNRMGVGQIAAICSASFYSSEFINIMSYSRLTKWIESGQTLIPNFLLQNYKGSGLTDTEFIFVLQLKAYIDKNIRFRIWR